MCRNIHNLFNFDPPTSEEEIRDAALQFVRKITGFRNPSKKNETAFFKAVDEITQTSTHLLKNMESTAEPKNREVEAERARARSSARYMPKPPGQG